MKLGQRGRFLTATAAIAAATLALAGCAGDSSSSSSDGDSGSGSEELRTVTVSAPPSYNALTLRVAEAEGYFEEVGLELEIVPTVGAEAVPQLLGGSLNFMLADMTTLVRATSEGLPLVIAAPNILLDAPDTEAYASILMRAEDEGKFSGPTDIAKGVVGIPSLNSQPWLDTRTVVEEAGGDPDAIEFIEVPNPLQALRQKQVDFVTAPSPTNMAGILDGEFVEIAPVVLNEMGGLIGYPYLTTLDQAASDPELVEKFRTAVIKANKLINSDRERALEVAATFLEVPENVLQASVLPKLGEALPTTEDVQKHIDRIVDAGIIKAEDAPDPAKLVTK
jgi:NitT/TauT family transport system substrate-binding protein